MDGEFPFRVDVKVVGENVWHGNLLRFSNAEDAEEWGRSLMDRWTLAEAMRVVPWDHPEREPYDPDDKHIVS